MEIAQPGTGVSLDAKESWAKSYIDPNRLNGAVVGIYDGQYSAQSNNGAGEYDSNGSRSSFTDTGATVFEFYTALDFPRSSTYNDEIPCQTGGGAKPFLTLDSNTMPKRDWYKVNIKSALANSSAPTACKQANPTLKTGKVVIFIKARWKNTSNTEGRVNAFKIGTAYTDGSSILGNTGLTGYYSQYTSAINPKSALNASQVDIGQYAVQNRVDPDNVQGRYYFGFAPDCRLAEGQTEKRWIKWKDVDYPAYYSGLATPRFRLVDVTNPSNVKVVKDVDGNDLDLSGSQLGGPNQYRERQAVFTGGHIYEWHWYNIASRDGIAFWLPYDDYPALVGGCGDYNQSINLAGTRGDGWYTTDFKATGGDTLTFFIDEAYTGGTGQVPETTTNAYLTSPNGSLYANTFSDPGGATNITNDGVRVGRAQVKWVLPGMGPDKPYVNRRWLFFSYPIRADAKNGAIHCFNATLTPKSSADPLGILTSNTVCVTIDNSLKPFLGTAGGDVHAGNCIVDGGTPAAGNGKITGPPPSGLNFGSSGQYIVSAGDAITNFGSGASPKDTPLSFGKNGKYGSMCRPTIGEMTKNLDSSDITQVNPDPAVTFNLASLAAGKRYVVNLPGGGSVTGIASAPVTIYSTGTVTIAGNFGSNVALKTNKSNIPVVGVIAKNIEIAPSVSLINALMYAENTIDTCKGQDIKTAAGVTACKTYLLVNGFAMAKDFAFKRTAGTSGLGLSELIAFTPAFYLSPPPGFTNATKAVKYLGELAPLY